MKELTSPSSPTEERVSEAGELHLRTARILLASAAFLTAAQLAWFWPFTYRNINADGISYIGIARHIASGEFRASLNGLWSPLISWLIALFAPFSRDLTLEARLINVSLFLLCLVLLHRLTLHLWNDRRLAALAVLWFVLARGVAAFSLSFIGADLLLTACALVYFIHLLGCLRRMTLAAGTWLGLAHGMAFLAKGIAMPWLMCSTVIVGAVAVRRDSRKAWLPFVVAVLIPCAIWVSWAFALQNKYGVFTSGYQGRFHLQRQAMNAATAASQPFTVVQDFSQIMDRYLVWDPMYPGSPLWRVSTPLQQVGPEIVHREEKNLLAALKDWMILLTPGGIIALALGIWRHADVKRRTASQFGLIVLVSTFALFAGYGMLMVDSRYILPVIPPVIAFAVAFVVPGWGPSLQIKSGVRLQWAISILLVTGLVGLEFYSTSPVRVLRRDYEVACYNAARMLEANRCGRVAIIGAGPFPEHGVGWEAGLYASYFANCRIAGQSASLPPVEKLPLMVADIEGLHPDSIMVWGSPADPRYRGVVEALQAAKFQLRADPILDPKIGEVGRLLTMSSPVLASR